MDESAVILKWGLHYQVVGYDVWLGEMLLAMGILILFGILNILGVKKAGIVQTILAALLGISVVTLTIAALASSKTSLANMAPWWGFHKSDAIAPWAYVGFDTIPQAAEEFKFSYKKVSGIMIVAIIFGCFVYTANNTITVAALENSASTPWLLLTAAECLLGTPGKILVGVAVSSAALSYPCPDQF